MAPAASSCSTNVPGSSGRNSATEALCGFAVGDRDTFVNLLCRAINETARSFGEECIVTTNRDVNMSEQR